MTGRVAVVTGGARGIGAAIAARLRNDGCTVMVGDLVGDPANPQVPELDVRVESSRERFLEMVLRCGRGIDVLINNAGVNDRRSSLESGWADWYALLEVNLVGTLEMSRACHPHLLQRHGCVVDLASTGGHLAIAGSAAYGVSKAAILHLTRILAVEWAPGVRVNSVSPTFVHTDMTSDVAADASYMAAKLASIPLGRVPEPADVADAVAFLAGPQARSVTGRDLAVDGGAIA